MRLGRVFILSAFILTNASFATAAPSEVVTIAREVKVTTAQDFSTTRLMFRDGAAKKRFVCAFLPGQKTGVPALISRFDSRRHVWTLKLVSRTTHPRIPAELTTYCSLLSRSQPAVTGGMASTGKPAPQASVSEAVQAVQTPSPAAAVTSAPAVLTSLHTDQGQVSSSETGPGSQAQESVVREAALRPRELLAPPPPASCQPVINLSVAHLTMTENSTAGLTFSVSQPAGCEDVQYSAGVSNPPARGTISLVGNSLSYTPITHEYGDSSVTINVTNTRGERASANVGITVERRNCTPGIAAIPTVTVAKGREVVVPIAMAQPEACWLAASKRILSQPAHGTARIAGNTLVYTPQATYTGSDSLMLIAENERGESAPRAVAFNVAPLTDQLSFSGDENSLEPYFDKLTPQEVRHFLCKFALCGNKELYDLGVSGTRTQLVNALLNYDSSSDLAALRARMQTQLGGVDVQTAAMQRGDTHGQSATASCGADTFTWTPFSAQTYWLTHLTHGNPLREHIALHLHQHVPVNMWTNYNGGLGGGCSSHPTYKGYVDLVRVHALGRPPQTVDEIPVTGSFINFIKDVTTDYQVNLYLTNVQPWVLPAGSSYWDWYHGVHNNNFARELLQLYTLGQYDYDAGRRVFTENDVQNVAAALAGNINPFYFPMSSAPMLRERPWRASGRNAGRVIEWNATYRDAGQKVIFENEGPGVRKVGDLGPADVFNSIRNHPAFQYVSRMFFSRSIYPGPSQELSADLDASFRSNDTRIPDLYRQLMNSSAAFSKRARNSSISSGSLHVLRMIHTLGANVSQLSSPQTEGGSTFNMLMYLMDDIGDSILNAPAVFGYGESGDGDGRPGENNFGQALLSTQRMLGRFNAPFKMMKFFLEGDLWWWDDIQPQEGFTIQTLLPSGSPTPTVDELIAHFENLFGVQLSTPEREAIRRYIIRPFRDPSTGITHAWDPSNIIVLRPRLVGLFSIFANLPGYNVR